MLQQGISYGLLCIYALLFYHHSAFSDYSLSVDSVRYKSEFYEAFEAQRELLFAVGFPNFETHLDQSLDSHSDSLQITGGYHFNRYHSIKVSYLGESEYSLKSRYSYLVPDSDTSVARTVRGRDSFKINITGLTAGLYSELPLREEVALGINLGAIVARVVSDRSIQGRVVSGDETMPNGVLSSVSNRSKTDYELNIMFGLYLSYRYSKPWRIKFQWNRYFDLGKKARSLGIVNSSGEIIGVDMDNGDYVDAYALGLEYRF